MLSLQENLSFFSLHRRIGRNRNAQARTPTPSTTMAAAATTTAVDSQGELTQDPTLIFLSQQTDSCVVDSMPSPIDSVITGSEGEISPEVIKTPDSANSGFTFWPELKDTEMSSTEAVAVNAYGASRSFSGPLFGRSLEFWQHRVGYPFPPCICNMLAYLQQVEHAAHGIFRRAGGKLRVQALRELIEKDISKLSSPIFKIRTLWCLNCFSDVDLSFAFNPNVNCLYKNIKFRTPDDSKFVLKT